MNGICVIIVGGPPGAGKSTICRNLTSTWKKCAERVIHISFDDEEKNLLTERSSNGLDAPRSPAVFRPDIWAEARQRSLQRLRSALREPNRPVILLDDTFHLSSMQKRVVRIVEDAVHHDETTEIVHLLTLFVLCSKEECCRRCGSREFPQVPSASVSKIHDDLLGSHPMLREAMSSYDVEHDRLRSSAVTKDLSGYDKHRLKSWQRRYPQIAFINGGSMAETHQKTVEASDVLGIIETIESLIKQGGTRVMKKPSMPLLQEEDQQSASTDVERRIRGLIGETIRKQEGRARKKLVAEQLCVWKREFVAGEGSINDVLARVAADIERVVANLEV